MDGLVGVVNGVSDSVKIGWIVWLAWCLVQIASYRHLMAMEPATTRFRDRSAGYSSDDRRSSRFNSGGSPDVLASLGLGDASGLSPSDYAAEMRRTEVRLAGEGDE